MHCECPYFTELLLTGFTELISGKCAMRVTRESTVAAMALAEAVNKAARTGQTVVL
jgi:hypothetical protein